MAYSINHYRTKSDYDTNFEKEKPHTTLEQRKFSNQMTICFVSPRRQTLVKSNDIKTKKEIYEWIQNDHPNGIEILTKVASQTRSNYKALINKALTDLKIVEKRANLMDAKDLEEKSKNAKYIEEQISEYQKKLQEKNDENNQLKMELSNSNSFLTALNDDIQKNQNIIKNVKSKLLIDENRDKNSIENNGKTANDIQKQLTEISTDVKIGLLKEEERRLETQLIELETRMMELTLEERAMLYGQFLPLHDNVNDNS